MIKRLILLILAVVQIHIKAYPIEGMWVPLLLDSLNLHDMQERGLRLTAEDIYSVNHASLKDAVVLFGGGCTGEIISPDGLLITNHHCGYSRISSHSTVDNNLLEKGFWAQDRNDELPNPGLTATFLIRIEDVTPYVLQGTDDSMAEQERNRIIASNTVGIVNEAIRDTHYDAEIKPFYFGQQFFLFIYEVFEDVRLVGAPPESIGRFGGDTDNWIWPRHTGDFSLFRIYADKDNKPAKYSSDNVPYQPRKYLPISLNGVNEGDFTMVIGYPARTDEYLLSTEIRMMTENCLPAKIQMRTRKLSALEKKMNQSDETKLRYAADYVSLSNAWKKWIGVVIRIQKTQTIDKKIQLEWRFDQWANDGAKGNPRYGGIMQRFNAFYDRYEPLYTAYDIGIELTGGIETFNLIARTLSLIYVLPDSSRSYRKEMSRKLISSIRNYYKSNPVDMDREILPFYLQVYYENTSSSYHPDFYQEIMNRFNGNCQAFVDKLYSKSIFADTTRLFRLFEKAPDIIIEKILNDPFHKLRNAFNRILTERVYPQLNNLTMEQNQLYRTYLKGLMEMDTGNLYYPDANRTMRVTYGKVEGYQPSDAIEYDYFTTLDGVIEKENPEIKDYVVSQPLKDIYQSGNFGRYAVNNQVPVCFIASNHTSGGNSGSPVLNADGQLIGINFDRNWEGTMSDYAYRPDICRNISLDIRYVLFIIDKLANAQHILDELTIIE